MRRVVPCYPTASRFPTIGGTTSEYLAARALAGEHDCIDKAIKHVYEPSWNQVLIMLGGLLDQPGPYVAALLRKNREDMFCRPFLLATQAAAEADGEQLPDGLLISLVGEALKLEQSTTVCYSSHIVDAIRYLPAWFEYLVVLLRRGRPKERQVAANRLGMHGAEQAMPVLIEALKDKNARVRQSVVAALGRIGLKEAIPVLWEVYRSDADWWAREVAMKALDEIQITQQMSASRDAAENGDEEVRKMVAEALTGNASEQAIQTLLKGLTRSSKSGRAQVAEVLGRIGLRQAIPGLLEGLDSDREDVYVRVQVGKALGRIRSEDAVPGLLKALKDKNEHVRSCAAEALGKIGSKEAIPGLLKAMRDKRSNVSDAAAEALSKIGSEQAVPRLVEMMRHRNKYTRAGAVTVLGRIGSKDAVPGLLKALKDKDEWVRAQAADALGRIGSKDAIADLLKALKDKNENVCRHATEALGDIDSEEVIPGLLEVLTDGEERVRTVAGLALRMVHLRLARPLAAEAAPASMRRALGSLTTSLDRIADFCEKPIRS